MLVQAASGAMLSGKAIGPARHKIQSLGSALLRDNAKDDTARNLLTLMEKSAQRGADIVRQVELAQWPGVNRHAWIAETQHPDFVPVTLTDIIQRHIDHTQNFAPGRFLDLRLHQVRAVGHDDQEIRAGTQPARGFQ